MKNSTKAFQINMNRPHCSAPEMDKYVYIKILCDHHQEKLENNLFCKQLMTVQVYNIAHYLHSIKIDT